MCIKVASNDNYYFSAGSLTKMQIFVLPSWNHKHNSFRHLYNLTFCFDKFEHTKLICKTLNYVSWKKDFWLLLGKPLFLSENKVIKLYSYNDSFLLMEYSAFFSDMWRRWKLLKIAMCLSLKTSLSHFLTYKERNMPIKGNYL